MRTIVYIAIGMICMISFNSIAQDPNDSLLTKTKTITAQSGDDFVLPEPVISVKEESHASKINDIEDRCSFLVLNNLARAARSIDQNKAFECLTNFLAYHNHLRERSQLFKQLSQGLTGYPEIELEIH